MEDNNNNNNQEDDNGVSMEEIQQRGHWVYNEEAIAEYWENYRNYRMNGPNFLRESVDEEASFSSCLYCLCDPCILNDGVPDMGVDFAIGEDIALAIQHVFEGVEELESSTLAELTNVLKDSYKEILSAHGYSDDWLPHCVEHKIRSEISMFVATNYTNGIRN